MDFMKRITTKINYQKDIHTCLNIGDADTHVLGEFEILEEISDRFTSSTRQLRVVAVILHRDKHWIKKVNFYS